jgi:molybdenum cofactor cytidylyltransferase
VWSLVAEAATPIGVTRYDDGESYPCWFGRELFGELRELRSDSDLWMPIHNGAHPVTKVDAIGNIPPRATTWAAYHGMLSGGTTAAEELPLDTHPIPVATHPRRRRHASS